jgi:hypothetical protein
LEVRHWLTFLGKIIPIIKKFPPVVQVIFQVRSVKKEEVAGLKIIQEVMVLGQVALPPVP